MRDAAPKQPRRSRQSATAGPRWSTAQCVSPISKRCGAIAAAVRRLDEAGIAIDDVAVRSPTLDDVFLSLTGRPPEAEEQSEVQATIR